MDKRNWFKGILDSWICDPETGDTVAYIPYLYIKTGNDSIIITAWQSGYVVDMEHFHSKEEIDGFIQALEEARDTVFE